MRGEQAISSQIWSDRSGSPPLARGTDVIIGIILVLHGITPACAGNSCAANPCACAGRDHPRLRGEQKAVYDDGVTLAGSPPLARGTVAMLNGKTTGRRITPACAGNRLSHTRRAGMCRDHPRLRGEQTKKRLVVPCILQYCFSFFNQFFVDMFC